MDDGVRPARRAAPLSARSGALEDMEKGRSCSVSGACHWAVNAAASAMHGKMWGKAYSVCVSGIFVAPDSPYHRPEDLAGVKVGVGYHSGSHYSAIQALEPFLERSEIALEFVGLPFDRVRLMQQGRIEAANVFGAQYYLLEQLGFRKLVDTTFIMGSLVSEDTDREDLERYFNALRRAQREIDLEAERYKHHWLREIPERSARGHRRPALRPRRADRLRALHPRDVRAHAPLDGELGAVRLDRGRAARLRGRGSDLTRLPTRALPRATSPTPQG